MPLVADCSSDIFSRPIDVAKYGLIYAGAQKNLGPSGVTLVIVRDDLLAAPRSRCRRCWTTRPTPKKKSLYNTPPCFGIYILGLVAQVAARPGRARGDRHASTPTRPKLVYAAIDGSGGFYRGTPKPSSRSHMNITFRLPTEALEKQFVTEATAAGLDGLERPSLGRRHPRLDLQRVPARGVEALVAFMQDFARKNG